MELKTRPAPGVWPVHAHVQVHMSPAISLGKAVKYLLPRVTPRRPPLAASTLWCELGSQLRHLSLQIVHALHQRHRMGATRLKQRRERAHLSPCTSCSQHTHCMCLLTYRSVVQRLWSLLRPVILRDKAYVGRLTCAHNASMTCCCCCCCCC